MENDQQNLEETYLAYYDYASVLKKKKRRYLSRKFLLGICTEFTCEAISEVTSNLCYDEERMTKEKFVQLTRILLWNFLRNESRLTIITAKKIRNDLVRDHLARRHEIREFLLNGFHDAQGDR